ncbi:MAG: 2-oxo acid dehydrogenase subunit E2, partial [Armatimonadota bacterium]
AEGVAWEGIDGTGPEGAIVEADVRGVLEERAGRTVREVLPIPRTAVAGWWSGAVTVSAEALLSLLAGWERAGLGIQTIYLTVVLLLAAAGRTPRINATIDGDAATVWNEVRPAVGVETDEGVRWPVLPGADGRTPRLLAAARRAVEADVLAGTHPARGYRGATIAVRAATHARIARLTSTPPAGVGAALGIGAPQPAPGGGQTLQVELTVDARLASVVPVERFLAHLAAAFENPLGALE